MNLKFLRFWLLVGVFAFVFSATPEVQAVGCTHPGQNCNTICTSGVCDITCVENCSYNFNNYDGTVNMDLSCAGHPGGTLNGSLTVNGVSDSIQTTCSSSEPDPDPSNCSDPQSFICDQDCTRECTNFEGIAELELQCGPLSGSSITGTLIVNGDSNTKTLACHNTGPVCATQINPTGWTAGNVEAFVGTC